MQKDKPQRQKMNRSLLLVFIIWVTTKSMDLLTAMQVQEVETNPLYLITGSFIIPIILTSASMVITLAILKRARMTNEIITFMLILFLVYSSADSSLRVYGNMQAANDKANDPVSYEMAASTSTEAKANNYVWSVIVQTLFNTVIPLTAFAIWQRSREYLASPKEGQKFSLERLELKGE